MSVLSPISRNPGVWFPPDFATLTLVELRGFEPLTF